MILKRYTVSLMLLIIKKKDFLNKKQYFIKTIIIKTKLFIHSSGIAPMTTKAKGQQPMPITTTPRNH